VDYLTNDIHLRLVWSDNGIDFKEDPFSLLSGIHETYGIEDRVSKKDTYHLGSHDAFSKAGVGLRDKQTGNI
jgi:hypothetical protein